MRVCVRARTQLICPTFCDAIDCSLPGSSCPWNFSGKNTGVDCHFPPPGDLPNPRFEPTSSVSPALHSFYPLSYQGSSLVTITLCSFLWIFNNLWICIHTHIHICMYIHTILFGFFILDTESFSAWILEERKKKNKEKEKEKEKPNSVSMLPTKQLYQESRRSL